jgi:hypothetical protein
MGFDEFKAIVLSAPGLSRDWNLVLQSLLKQIQKTKYDQSTDRFYPWVMRADSSNLGLSDAGDTTLSAMSINIPYFALNPISSSGIKLTDQKNSVMTLFEWDDRFESTKEWDSEQSFRVMSDRPDDKDSAIHVPHVWTMVFSNSKFIISMSQIPLLTTHSNHYIWAGST